MQSRQTSQFTRTVLLSPLLLDIMMEKLEAFIITAMFSAFIIGAHGRNSEECNIGPISACRIELLNQLADLPNIVPDEQFLKENCSLAIAELQCLNIYEKRCGPSGMPTFYPFRKAYELRLFVRDLCDENSMLRKEYLENTGCLNSHTDAIREIALAAGEQVDEFWKQHNKGSPTRNSADERRGLLCVYLSLLESSETAYISLSCGDKAKNMAWNLYTYIMKPREIFCPKTDKTVKQYFEAFEDYSSTTSSAGSVSFFLSPSRLRHAFYAALNLYLTI